MGEAGLGTANPTTTTPTDQQHPAHLGGVLLHEVNHPMMHSSTLSLMGGAFGTAAPSFPAEESA